MKNCLHVISLASALLILIVVGAGCAGKHSVTAAPETATNSDLLEYFAKRRRLGNTLTGTEAATYTASFFRQNGLLPAGERSGYFVQPPHTQGPTPQATGEVQKNWAVVGLLGGDSDIAASNSNISLFVVAYDETPMALAAYLTLLRGVARQERSAQRILCIAYPQSSSLEEVMTVLKPRFDYTPNRTYKLELPELGPMPEGTSATDPQRLSAELPRLWNELQLKLQNR